MLLKDHLCQQQLTAVVFFLKQNQAYNNGIGCTFQKAENPAVKPGLHHEMTQFSKLCSSHLPSQDSGHETPCLTIIC